MNAVSKPIRKVSDVGFELWRLLDQARCVIGRLRELELAVYGLTTEQAQVLNILFENNGFTTINTIVDNTMRRHHSISTLIDRMKKQGLIRKRKSLTDKRQYEIIATKKSRILFGKLTRDSLNETFSGLSTEDKLKLENNLKTITRRAHILYERRHGSIKPEK